MQLVADIDRSRSAAPHSAALATVFVDCADPTRHDLITYWIGSEGHRVHEHTLPDPADPAAVMPAGSVIVSDRFGTGGSREQALLDIKARWPAARIVIVGHGDPSEVAQLALARVAGMDGTLGSPLRRERVLELVAAH